VFAYRIRAIARRTLWFRNRADAESAAYAIPGGVVEQVEFTAKLSAKESLLAALNGDVEKLGGKVL
jgi:hypothetical protein